MQSDRQLLDSVLQKLEKLENSHINLERKINEIHKNTNLMEEHINFVENTYNKVKTPFHYIMDKVKILSYNPFKKLEENEKEKLENKESN